MRKIVSLGLVAVILGMMAVAILPVLQPQPLLAMSGNGTAGNPYMVYNVTDLQAINDHIGPRYSRPWDDNFGEAAQNGTWTIYPEDGELVTQLFWDKVDEVTSDSDSTYIQAESDNAYVLLSYEGTPLSLPDLATNIVVIIRARVRNTASGTSYIQGMVRDNVADYLIGSDTAISSTSYALKSWTMNNPPWRSWDVWTTADVYALTTCGVGVKVSDASPNIRITQLYLGVTYDLSAYYELANDIDASATSGWNAGAGFVPIGEVGDYFTGSLDGKDYKITDLYINRSTTDCVGLFGAIYGATLTDITLEGVNITGSTYVGGLIGYSTGWTQPSTISGCSVSGQVSGGAYVGGMTGYSRRCYYSDCHADVEVTGSSDYVGGFVGYVYGEGADYEDGMSATSCSAIGDVTGTRRLGGFVGYVDFGATFLQCFASGVVSGNGAGGVGGFVGYAGQSQMSECYALGDIENVSTGYNGGFVGQVSQLYERDFIRNCYSRGAVSTNNVNATTGGFVGYAASSGAASTIENCYSTGLVTAIGVYLGGFAAATTIWGGQLPINSFWDTVTSGQATSDGGTGKTTAEMKAIATFDTAGWDIAPAYIPALYRNDGYPVHGWFFGMGDTWLIHSGGITSDIYQVVWFQPNAIILGTTLPNRTGEEDGIITWGANPAGISITYSMLQPEKEYQFEPFLPPSLDIIDPEPGGMTSDMNLDRLKKNPLRPLAQVISATSGMTERLAWLGIAIFVLIALMIYVQLKTTHIVFTSLVGLGVATSFYLIGVFPLWVVVVLVFGLVGSIIYERMPVL